MGKIDFVLYESPVGYAFFQVVQQVDSLGLNNNEVQETVCDLSKFGKLIKLVNFSPFRYELVPWTGCARQNETNQLPMTEVPRKLSTTLTKSPKVNYPTT